MRRYLPPPSLVIAAVLLLVAPALAYHVASTGNEHARDLESSSTAGPEVRLTGPLTSPTAASIVDPVPFADGTGASATYEDVLVRVRVTSVLPPKVAAEVRLPGEHGLAAPVTLDGVLAVTEDAEGTRVDVRDGASVPFTARVDPQSGAVRVTWRGDDGQRVVVEHAATGTGVVLTEDGDLARFVVQDPLTAARGGAELAELVGVEATPDGARVALLGDALALPGTELEGNPFDEDGAVVLDDSGLGLLVVRAQAPDVLGAPVTIGLEGPALAELYPGAESATLTLDASRVPFGVAVLTIAGTSAATDQALVLAAGTGVKLLDLHNGPAGLVVSDAYATAHATVTSAPVTFRQATSGGSGLVVTGTANGQDVVEVAVTPGATDVITVRHAGGALGSTVGADATVLVDAATGLVASVNGSEDAPDGVALGTTTGSTLVRAEPVAGGGLAVSWPGAPNDAPHPVPGGRIVLDADPSSLAPWRVRVLADGATVLDAEVDRASMLAGAGGVARPVVKVHAPGTAQTVTLAPPVALEGDVAGKRVTAVSVLDPLAPEKPLARAEATSTGWSFTTPLGAHATSASGITFPADALTADVVTFTAADGALTVDRRTGAAVVDAGDKPVRVQGPVAYSGDPTNPDVVHVADPDDANAPLVRYSRGGSLRVLGEEHAFNARTVTFEGDARSPRGFAFVVTSPDGTVEERHHVSPRALTADAGVPAPLRDALLTMIESGDADPRYVTHVADARGHVLDREALLNAWGTLALAAPHEARVDVPRAADAFTRVVIEAWSANAAHAPERAVLPRVADAGDAFVYAGAFTPPAADGQMVHALVRYETEVTPFVRRAVEESGLAYRVDGTGPRVRVDAPASSASAAFTVAWVGADAETPAAFEVQKREDGGAWSTWLALTEDASATFTGTPGASYAFRARGVDGVGNAGPWSTPATVQVGANAPAPSPSPGSLDATLLAPTRGDVLTGVVTVEWSPLPDGALANVYASRDGGRSWKALHSGAGSSFAWDTEGERDGAWTLRLVVTDGSAEAEDVVGPVTLRNKGVAAAHVTEATAQATDDAAGDATSAPTGGSAGASGAGGGDAEGDASVLARLALTGAGLVAAAILVVLGVVLGKRRN